MEQILEKSDSPDKPDNADTGRPFSCGQSGDGIRIDGLNRRGQADAPTPESAPPAEETAEARRKEIALRALVVAGVSHTNSPDGPKLKLAPPLSTDPLYRLFSKLR